MINYIIIKTGGFYGSKDPFGKELIKKREMLEEEGVIFEENKTKVNPISVFTFS